MALAIILLERKLRMYVDQLRKSMEQAEGDLSFRDVFTPSSCYNPFDELRNSAAILDKLLSRVKEIEHEIHKLSTLCASPGTLTQTIYDAYEAEIEATVMIAKIEVILSNQSRVEEPEPALQRLRENLKGLHLKASSAVQQLHTEVPQSSGVPKEEQKITPCIKPSEQFENELQELESVLRSPDSLEEERPSEFTEKSVEEKIESTAQTKDQQISTEIPEKESEDSIPEVQSAEKSVDENTESTAQTKDQQISTEIPEKESEDSIPGVQSAAKVVEKKAEPVSVSTLLAENTRAVSSNPESESKGQLKSAPSFTEKQAVVARENSSISDEAEKTPVRPFTLKRFYGFREDFAVFWNEFHETVDKSRLDVFKKFSALRSLIRGEPYRLFLDLDYTKEEDYKKALKRLFDYYADEELKKNTSADLVSDEDLTESIPCDENLKNYWSCGYFFAKYCQSVPRYEKPNRELLTRAIHAFLNFYVQGSQDEKSCDNLEYVWLILLHGVKFDDRYIIDCRENIQIFGNETAEEIPFPDIPKSQRKEMQNYEPYFLKKREKDVSRDEPGTISWKFVKKHIRLIKNVDVEEWYNCFWEAAETVSETEFQEMVKYFALLSMLLLRVVIKSPESVERYIATTFEKLRIGFIPELPKINYRMMDPAPPHAGIYRLIRENLFKRDSSNFKTYLTYLVGCYLFFQVKEKPQLVCKARHYLMAGCLLPFSYIGIRSFEWLHTYAEQRKMEKRELLKFFSIDPSLETKIKEVEKLLEIEKYPITWRWARLFEKDALKEFSTADCPSFAFACFVLVAANDKQIQEGKKYPQFLRFTEGEIPPSLTGENLGVVLKYLTQSTDYFYLSNKSMIEAFEMMKCDPDRP